MLWLWSRGQLCRCDFLRITLFFFFLLFFLFSCLFFLFLLVCTSVLTLILLIYIQQGHAPPVSIKKKEYYQEIQKKKAHNCAKMVNHRQGQLKLFYIINLIYFKSDQDHCFKLFYIIILKSIRIGYLHKKSNNTKLWSPFMRPREQPGTSILGVNF